MCIVRQQEKLNYFNKNIYLTEFIKMKVWLIFGGKMAGFWLFDAGGKYEFIAKEYLTP